MKDRLNIAAWHVFALVMVLFMLSPLVMLVIFTFNESPLLNFPLTGFSLRWIKAVFERPDFVNAFRNSLIVTGAVGLASTVVGTMTGMALGRLPVAVSSVVLSVITLPIMVPPLMLGLAFLSYYTGWLHLDLGLPTVIISHLVFTQPFVILIVSARLATFDYSAVDSARDLGATSLTAFITVTLPIIRSSVLGAALIAMALSLDDFLVTFFTIGGRNTLPTFMWGMLRKGLDPSVNVVAVLIMLLSIGVSILGMWATRYRG